MYVHFTAPQSGEVTLTLSRDAGEGATYFDDVRIVENEAKNITKMQMVKLLNLNRILKTMYREFIHLLLVEVKA